MFEAGTQEKRSIVSKGEKIFLEKACKAASECQNGFAVYEEMVKSLPLFNALVTVTYKAYEGTYVYDL